MKDNKTGRFADLGISRNLLEALNQKGFVSPTPIQHQVIPDALEGKDIVGIAQTGTGKTLGFGIPMIERLISGKGQGLVLVPTRELAGQVHASLDAIGRPLGLRSVAVIGGVSQNAQVRALKQKPHIIVATPGRLDDLVNQGACHLRDVKIVTMDEADRMLDVGFLPNIKRIMKGVPQQRQTLLFSATMPKSVSKLASEFMKLPLRIEVAPEGTSAENVEQEIFVVLKNKKMRLLDSLLSKYSSDTILIFSRTKHGAKRIARDIRNMGHTSTEIHGNRSQRQREMALDGFRKGRFRVMVATDIAARGIDVKDISLVINFDLPDSLEDYVHRIGRTGRAGRFGKAISFVTPGEKSDIRRIEKMIRKAIPVLALPELPPEREKPPVEETQHRRHQRSFRGQPNGHSRGSSKGSRGNKRRRGRWHK
ncbi:DEAD/DEAH box helicase [Candidatus Nomurabacteria bacterium]|nr:DEAD/DEAH box helicase [Candidatus Nomurabacteria bacterium]